MSTNVKAIVSQFSSLLFLLAIAIGTSSCEKEYFAPRGNHVIHSNTEPADTTSSSEGVATEDIIINEP